MQDMCTGKLMKNKLDLARSETGADCSVAECETSAI